MDTYPRVSGEYHYLTWISPLKYPCFLDFNHKKQFHYPVGNMDISFVSNVYYKMYQKYLVPPWSFPDVETSGMFVCSLPLLDVPALTINNAINTKIINQLDILL